MWVEWHIGIHFTSIPKKRTDKRKERQQSDPNRVPIVLITVMENPETPEFIWKGKNSQHQTLNF